MQFILVNVPCELEINKYDTINGEIDHVPVFEDSVLLRC